MAQDVTHREGGCLCGNARYGVDQQPDWVTVCYCRFCQRATGGSGMIEPIFKIDAFRVLHGRPSRYTHVSEGSGKNVFVHFCADCGTKLFLTFERWPDRLGVYAGTFDDPEWFRMTPDNTKHIFLESARTGTLIPSGFNTFRAHAATPDGTSLAPEIFDEVHKVG